MNKTIDHSDISLLIADDQTMLLDGWVMLLKLNNFKIAGQESDVHKVVERYKEIKPDILICDVMFDMKPNSKNGLDVAREVLEFNPKANIAIYSQFDNEEYMKEAYSKGVKCFLTKNVGTDELILALEKASRGQQYFPERVAQTLASLSVKKPLELSPKDLLSERLLSVFRLMAMGKTQNEIADYRKVHVRTVANDVREIKDILNTKNQAVFTMLAIKYKLINIDDVLKKPSGKEE